MTNVFTFDSNLTERQLLKREFGLELCDLGDREKKNSIDFDSKTILLATCRIKTMGQILNDCPDKSVVLFFFGNETYNLEDYIFLNYFSNKIKFGLLYNVPKSSSLSQITGPVFGTAFDLRFEIFSEYKAFYRNVKNGFDLLSRTKKINLNFPYMEFPQGYSARFVYELEISGLLDANSSVLNCSSKIKGEKDIVMSFVGQQGSWYRQHVLKLAKKYFHDFDPILTQGWAGERQGQKTTYLQSLRSSKFVLHPPGNLTNKTHRYLESLLMGALPVLPPSTIQDPHLWEVWSENLGRFSWIRIFEYLSNMDEIERVRIVENALALEFVKYEKIRRILVEVIE